jgi:hypothetical protein
VASINMSLDEVFIPNAISAWYNYKTIVNVIFILLIFAFLSREWTG